MFSLFVFFFFLMIRRPPRSTLSSSSAASDVYKRQVFRGRFFCWRRRQLRRGKLSLIHISEPTRLLSSSYAVFCLKKKKNKLLNSYFVIIDNKHTKKDNKNN